MANFVSNRFYTKEQKNSAIKACRSIAEGKDQDSEDHFSSIKDALETLSSIGQNINPSGPGGRGPKRGQP